MADVKGVTLWLMELIAAEVARDADLSDFTINVEDNQFAVVSPEGQSVYLVTVQEAHFAVASKEEKSR